MMQEDAPPWPVLVILAVRGSPYETRAASPPAGERHETPDPWRSDAV